MPFLREASHTDTPAAIGQVQIALFQNNSASTGLDDATVNFTIMGADGTVLKSPTVPLLQHLTAGQITTASNFINTIRSKIVAEVLP